MRPLTLVATLAIAICFADSSSKADENVTNTKTPLAQPPRPIPTAEYYTPTIALPGQPLHVTAGQPTPYARSIATPVVPHRVGPIVADKSRTKIKLARTDIAMMSGTESFVDLDTRVTTITVEDPKRVSAEPVSKKSVKLKALNVGVTRVTLNTAEHGKHTLFVSVTPNMPELAKRLKPFMIKHLELTITGYDLHISGIVQRQEDVKKILAVADNYATRITSRLYVENESGTIEIPQVMIHCHVLEFRPAAGSSLAEVLQKACPGLGKTGFGLADDLDFNQFVTALSEHGTTKILAEPKLVTTDGRPAKLHIGNEIRVPGKQPGTFEFRPIGTVVEATPVIVDNDKVRLQINAEINWVNQPPLMTDTGPIPYLSTQRISTMVQLKFGQSLVLSGPLLVNVKPNADTNDEKTTRQESYTIWVVKVESIAPTDPASKTDATATASKVKATVRE